MMQDGLANLLLLGTHSVVSKSKVESSVPSKGAKGAKAAFADKAVTAFHKKVFDAVVRHVNWEVVKCLVLAGPGSAKDDFRKYLELEMVRQNVRCGTLPWHCSSLRCNTEFNACLELCAEHAVRRTRVNLPALPVHRHTVPCRMQPDVHSHLPGSLQALHCAWNPWLDRPGKADAAAAAAPSPKQQACLWGMQAH